METKQDQVSAEINIDINGPDSSTNQTSTMRKMKAADELPQVGLTKDELMKYADDPFWVRLRNVLFATFWIVWVSILIAAIGYVFQSPGCRVASASPVAPLSSTTPASG